MLKTARVWVENILRIMTLLWLMAHFTLTLIYVFPTNPMQVTLEPLLNATIDKHFPQNWSMFASDSIFYSDFALLVRPLNNDDFKTIRTKGWPNDGWYDLSTPLWTKFQHNHFSAYASISSPMSSAILHYFTRPQQKRVHLMVKIASAFCKDIGQHNASYVALMIRGRRSRLWPEKGASEQPVIKIIRVGIYPIDRNVKNMNLYQIEDNNGYTP